MTLRYCNPTEGGMLRAVEKMDGILGVKEETIGNISAIGEVRVAVSQSLLSN
jgi:hypothetical protein